jgi:hypothetical protein
VPSHSRRDLGIAVALLACGVVPALGGCAERQVHATAPLAPIPTEAVRPMTIAPDTDATPPPENGTVTAPSLPTAATATPPPVALPTEKPPAPRKPAAEQAPTDADSSSPSHPAPAPQISPQLSPSDAAAYQRKTGEDISVAENNLHQTDGKRLNAAQSDLTEKVRTFLAQSRDASKDGDWARAQNLAQKARVLSVELINSL